MEANETKSEWIWIKFYPSLNLPKERVSIVYDTHDERGVRYAYGYFQFYNGTCGCFRKDGNEQPKVVKAEDIKYWMPVPSLDMQKEPVSEDSEVSLVKKLIRDNNICGSEARNVNDLVAELKCDNLQLKAELRVLQRKCDDLERKR